ncbi:MAG: peptidoglycan DD-metalloendopeptidase family protein [Spirochaetales bacterium]|nr:peptidoglycan DD-metalloendopeptidase family protein [Spirochaetales bacterium]
MIVPNNRQEIDGSLKKKKKLSPRPMSTPRPRKQVCPFLTGYLLALCLFFTLLGTEIPYKQIMPVNRLKNLTMPGEMALEQVEIKTLRAGTAVVLTPKEPALRQKLWDVPAERYRMKSGERLSSVSLRYGRSLSTLISFNSLESISSLKADDILMIPSVEGILYEIPKGGTLESVLFKFGLAKNEILLYNPHIIRDGEEPALQPGQELFLPGVSLSEEELREKTGQRYIFPVQGRILTSYGTITDSVTQIESFHNGIDIKGNTGDPVAAALDGTVISAGFNNSYGNFIVLDHRNGYKTLYAHLNSISVRRNDKVLQGEIIAEVGKSGFAPSAHLHFSLFKGKKSVDPLDYLH